MSNIAKNVVNGIAKELNKQNANASFSFSNPLIAIRHKFGKIPQINIIHGVTINSR